MKMKNKIRITLNCIHNKFDYYSKNKRLISDNDKLTRENISLKEKVIHLENQLDADTQILANRRLQDALDHELYKVKKLRSELIDLNREKAELKSKVREYESQLRTNKSLNISRKVLEG